MTNLKLLVVFTVVLCQKVSVAAELETKFKLYPQVGMIVRNEDGDEFFGAPYQVPSLIHAPGDSLGAFSPLRSPDKVIKHIEMEKKAQKNKKSGKKPTVARKLSFDQTISDTHHDADIKKLFARIDERAKTYAHPNYVVKKKSTLKKSAPTIVNESHKVEPKEVNKLELQECREAIVALEKLIESRKIIMQLDSSVKFENILWENELSNLYGQESDMSLVYQCRLEGCHSFADVQTEATKALQDTLNMKMKRN